MDAEKIKEEYVHWHQIADLRRLGLSRPQIAKKLELPIGRVRRLSKMKVGELLQRRDRPRPAYPRRLDSYEESVKSLLTVYPYYSAAQIHERLKESDSFFPCVCEKTVYNYVQYIKKKYNIPQRE